MSTSAVWSSYLSARRMVLSACADHLDSTRARDAAKRLEACLGVEGAESTQLARRCIYYLFDSMFHELLLSSGDVDVLREIANRIEVNSSPFLHEQREGIVAVSLNYGLATSMLPLWLAMAVPGGRFGKIAVINRSRRDVNSKPSAQRLEALTDLGAYVDIDLARVGEHGGMRQALQILREGGLVLIFADGQLARSGAKGAMTCQLGIGSVTFPRGLAWLAQTAEVPIAPVLLRYKGDAQQIIFGAARPASEAQSTVQAMLDMAMNFDPAPWHMWCSS